MKHWYIILSSTWAKANDGAQKGLTKIAVATTNDGRRVVSINALNDWPELFEGAVSRVPVCLTPADFPTPINDELNP